MTLLLIAVIFIAAVAAAVVLFNRRAPTGPPSPVELVQGLERLDMEKSIEVDDEYPDLGARAVIKVRHPQGAAEKINALYGMRPHEKWESVYDTRHFYRGDGRYEIRFEVPPVRHSHGSVKHKRKYQTLIVEIERIR
jgi:hypothetical protein